MRPAAPRDVGGEDEDDSRDEVDQPGEDHLDRVEALELVVEAEAEDRQHHDPLGRAEVAAVDPAGEHAQHHQGPGTSAAVRTMPGQELGQPWLNDDEDQRHGDERRHDFLERGRRQAEQEHRADDPAHERGAAQLNDPSALAGQLAPVADRPGHAAGRQTHGVGDVGGHGRSPDGCCVGVPGSVRVADPENRMPAAIRMVFRSRACQIWRSGSIGSRCWTASRMWCISPASRTGVRPYPRKCTIVSIMWRRRIWPGGREGGRCPADLHILDRKSKRSVLASMC